MWPSGGSSSTAKAKARRAKDIFPASVTLTADLHSMGQYIQQGERTLMETIVSIGHPKHTLKIASDCGAIWTA